MSAFRVGQRVKRISNPGDPSFGPPVNSEGAVTRVDSLIWVTFDAPYPWFSGSARTDYGCEYDTITPLTPPAEDTWAADKVKQLTKPQYVEPVAPKVSA